MAFWDSILERNSVTTYTYRTTNFLQTGTEALHFHSHRKSHQNDLLTYLKESNEITQ